MKIDKDTVLLAALAVGGFILYKTVKGIGTGAAAALTSVGSAVGTGLFNVFHPNSEGETLYFTTTFADGARHAVPSSSVAADGQFTYSGKRYQMLNDKAGAHYAAPL